MSAVTPTEAHKDLVRRMNPSQNDVRNRRYEEWPAWAKRDVQLIAESEARAVEAKNAELEHAHSNSDRYCAGLIRIADALGIFKASEKMDPDTVLDRFIAERDQLRAEVERLKRDYADAGKHISLQVARAEKAEAEVAALHERNGQQLAACDCAAMMDTAETHEKNKTITRDNPFWSPAFESVMRRTAECIELREKVRVLREAMTHIAAFDEGPIVNSGFDEPGAARTARSALRVLAATEPKTEGEGS